MMVIYIPRTLTGSLLLFPRCQTKNVTSAPDLPNPGPKRSRQSWEFCFRSLIMLSTSSSHTRRRLTRSRRSCKSECSVLFYKTNDWLCLLGGLCIPCYLNQIREGEVEEQSPEHSQRGADQKRLDLPRHWFGSDVKCYKADTLKRFLGDKIVWETFNLFFLFVCFVFSLPQLCYITTL